MTTVFLLVCLAGIAYLVVRVGVASVREDLRAKAKPAERPAPPEHPRPTLDVRKPALFFIKPTPPLVVDGRLCRTDGAFGGVVGLSPGEHKVETATHTARCALADDAVTVLDFSTGEPEFLDPTVGVLMVKSLLERAPREAIMTEEELLASPTPAEALRAAESTLDVLETSLGGKDPRIFADPNLAELDRAYQAWRKGGDVAPYVESLRLHYVPDSQMAKQVPYFTRYAERLLAHLAESPALLGTEARRYLQYLARDLADTGDAVLTTHGKALASLLSG